MEKLITNYRKCEMTRWIKPAVGWGLIQPGKNALCKNYDDEKSAFDNCDPEYERIRVALVPYTVAKRAGLIRQPKTADIGWKAYSPSAAMTASCTLCGEKPLRKEGQSFAIGSCNPGWKYYGRGNRNLRVCPVCEPKKAELLRRPK